jgi:thymidylate synthase
MIMGAASIEMIIEGRYLDEILRKLYAELVVSTDTFEASKGRGQDLLGAKVLLKNPRARISATATRGRLVSALAEFCWYMSGSADLEFIRFYLPDYPPEKATGSIEEAYGPRLIGTSEFGYSVNQIDRVIQRLKARPDTRRAAIVLLESSDLQPEKLEAPCTSTLQFIHRRGHLHLVAMMRSNDAYLGFTHDIFCFTMIQELIARALGAKVGEYHHFATSLHLYGSDVSKVWRYLDEGFQNPTFAMPKMPNGCQRTNLENFLSVEKEIRAGAITRSAEIMLPDYWRDLALVLLRFADIKMQRGVSTAEENFAAISDAFYRSFYHKKPSVAGPVEKAGFVQEELDLNPFDEQNQGQRPAR